MRSNTKVINLLVGLGNMLTHGLKKMIRTSRLSDSVVLVLVVFVHQIHYFKQFTFLTYLISAGELCYLSSWLSKLL